MMFAHLHCHSRGSFSDSILKIEEAVEKAASDGQPGIALTDHGTLHRPLSFIKICRERGIVPVVGCECYFVESAKNTIRKSDNKRYHLVLLAKDGQGIKNLITIINKSWEENCFMERRGLVDWKLLKKYSSGLICLTGCFWNIIARTGVDCGEDEAEEKFREFYDIFGQDLYAELGRHGVKEEERCNELLVKLSKKYGVKPVVTNDVHYLNKKDSLLHSCFIRSRFNRLSSFTYEGSGFHLKTISEMNELGFKKQYLENTLEVVNKCSVDEDCFEKGEDSPELDLSKLFDSGCAAFTPEILKVGPERAEYICMRLDAGKEEAERLTGQWREVAANLSRVVVSVNPPLTQITPVFKWKSLRVCQFSEEELRRQGVFIVDTQRCREKALL